MDISIVIPIYNASNFIKPALHALIPVLERTHSSFEILMRDDGSSDHSAALLEQVAYQDSRVRVFRNERNRGLGFTLRKLFEDAKGDAVIYLDCDLPFGAEVVPVLLRELNQYEVAVASRYSGSVHTVPWQRSIVSRLYFLLCRILFGISVRDPGSGAVAIKKSALAKMKLTAEGFDIHVQMFSQARTRGLSVREIPLASSGPGQASFQILKHGPTVVLQTLRWRLKGLR